MAKCSQEELYPSFPNFFSLRFLQVEGRVKLDRMVIYFNI